MQQPPPVPQLLERLAGFAAQLQQTLTVAGIDWQFRPDDASWSLTQVMCHLRDVEREIHQSRFRRLIAREDAFIAGTDADQWAVPRRYDLQDGPQALADFLAARQQTLALLFPLDEATWQRRGQHAFFGPTSMHELLNLVAGHDAAHWQQISGLLGRRQAQSEA